ncbi:MAG: hypothetical protein OEY03_01505, partial [Rhizobacter sp.]|nr:hypothetical protein [Rhizobacter sp.]
MARTPSFEKTTALVSRALKLSPEALRAGFRPANLDDLAQILALRAGVLGGDLRWNDQDYLSWRYHFGSLQRGRGECWVVKIGAQLLAMVGTEEILVRHQGNAVPGLSVMDIAVRPELEGIGLGVWMAMQLCHQSECVVAIGSNANSRAIVSRVLSRVPDRRSYAHLIEFDSMFKRRSKHPWLAAAAAAMAHGAMSIWRCAAFATRSRAILVRQLQRFEADSVEPLIAASQTTLEISLGRSAAFLNWRLFDNPRTRYSVWGAWLDARLVGYVAVRPRAADDGTKSLVIEDLLVRADDRRGAALLVLLCEALGLACAQGCERV